MNEHEFYARYTELMKSIEPSEELVAATLARAKRQTAHPARKKRFRKPYAIAACFVAGALVIGGIGYAAAISGGAIPSPQPATQAGTQGFTVRAWASDGGTILPTEEGQIVLDRTHAQWAETGNENAGYFTGCTFTVEGDGITRVQASVSAGELYRQDITTISQSEDPIAFYRAVNWEDSFRGLEGLFENCDSVVVTNWDTQKGGDLNGEGPRGDQEIQAAQLKRYGSVVNLSIEEAPGIVDGTTCFGLFNPNVEDDPLALFEGATLTVTVTFEDGSTSTQTITLHEAMFRVEPHYTDNPTFFDMTSEITSREVDTAVSENRTVTPVANGDGTYSIASVYGEVVSCTSDPFPDGGKTANEFAGTLMPNSIDKHVSLVDETEPIGKSSSELEIMGANGSVAAQTVVMSNDEYGNPRVALVDCSSTIIHAPTVAFSDAPPLGRTKDEYAYLRGFKSDSAYADKWLEQRFGIAFNDDGTLATDGFTFATITMDIENTGDADESFVGECSNLASLVVIGADGSVSRISRTSYELVEESTASSQADDYVGTLYTAPANSHVTCAFAYAIPSHFVTDGNLYVMVNGKLFPVSA